MSIALFILLSAALLFELHEEEVGAGAAGPRCRTCRYSLAGLPGRGTCPECGAAYEPAERAGTITRISRRRGVTGFWLLALAAFVALYSMEIPRLAYAHVAIRSYLEDGYRLDVAQNAAFTRELGGGRDEFVHSLAMIGAAFLLLLGFVPGGWTRAAALAGGILAILALVYLLGLLAACGL